MRKHMEIGGSVRKYEETYVPKPTWRTMAAFLLLCAAIVGLRLFLR
jgi:hypothetical protein